MILLRTLVASLIFTAAAAPALAQDYAAPMNAAGQPDLSGHWTNASSTLLERDPRFGERITMSDEEAAALPRNSGQMTVGGKVRTSFLVAPADGQLPNLTPAARAKLEDRRAEFPRGLGFGRGDNPESMTLAERCLRDFGSSLGPPMMPVGYNNTYQIVQTGDHVMILVEMIHDARIIPIGGKHRPDAIRSWMGDSAGHYEGGTLVVETTNFRPGLAFRGAPEDITLIERFTRVSDTQILYAFEINEPDVFTAPIRAEIALNATKGPVLEYACHEGNYSFGNQLQTQRLAED
ncbi:MAG: hypothetical protein B7Y90_04120 [Alphaproteobacteria bacterium 32-64-14]|nr:MAG: hypothetical protein B7Y90_04120 [Alphaproteobacteria bacterium 32-64-14]